MQHFRAANAISGQGLALFRSSGLLYIKKFTIPVGSFARLQVVNSSERDSALQLAEARTKRLAQALQESEAEVTSLAERLQASVSLALGSHATSAQCTTSMSRTVHIACSSNSLMLETSLTVCWLACSMAKLT